MPEDFPQETLTRRLLLERVGVLIGTAATVPVRTLAATADPPHLSPGDPVAVALGYTEDAAKVDKGKTPSYRAGEKCANCMQNTGVPGQPWGPCKVFAGKLVNEDGWCRAYVKKG